MESAQSDVGGAFGPVQATMTSTTTQLVRKCLLIFTYLSYFMIYLQFHINNCPILQISVTDSVLQPLTQNVSPSKENEFDGTVTTEEVILLILWILNQWFLIFNTLI